MTVNELFNKSNYTMVYKYLKKHSPYTNGFEYEYLSHKKQLKIKNALKKKYFRFLNKLKNIEPISDENRILVISKIFNDVDGYKQGFDYTTFYVYKDDVIKKSKKEDVALWNGNDESRIEHYSISEHKFAEILGYEICPASLSLNHNLLTALILIEMSEWGFEEKQINYNLEKLYASLDAAMEDVKEGRIYTEEDMEIFFDEWREEIMGRKETEEEKRIRKEESEKRLNRSLKITEENHKIVINDVLSIIE